MATAQWDARPFSEKDLTPVLDLRKRIFDEEGYDTGRWRWQYQRNPQGQPQIWLATGRERPAEIAGHYAIMPYKLKHKGRVILASQSLDTFTNPDYRNQGIFVGLANKTFEQAAGQGVSLVFGFPNPSSYPGFIGKLGFVSPFQIHHWIRPLKLSYVLRRIPLLGGLSGLPDFNLPIPASDLSGEFTAVTAIPPDWDSLLAGFEDQFEMGVRRDASYMKWRYFECPDRKYQCFEYRSDGKLAGFAVLKSSGNIGQIVDLLAADRKIWKQLIKKVLKHFLSQGMNCAQAYLHTASPVASAFSGQGFIRSPRGTNFIVRSLDAGFPVSAFTHPQDWFLMAGDTDYF